MLVENGIAHKELKVSQIAETLIGSEIIKIAGDVNEKIKAGEKIHNLTIGDFDPKIFPVPEDLQNEIIKAYETGHTNYPAANGILELRKSVSEFIRDKQNLNYSSDEILISGGARPLIYGVYRTILDAGDKVIFPVPSWNNNHYCHLSGAEAVMIEAKPENNFMPDPDELKKHLETATLLSLCSPLNPTGTIFTREALEKICDLVILENKRRTNGEKPLYILYDQIYWVLIYGKNKHVDPVSLRPELRNYTIYIDGISKSFAATGVRVGWAFGPPHVINKMKAMLSHIGAWAPKAEQVATAKFLDNKDAVDTFITKFKSEISQRLDLFYQGFSDLKKKGFKVDVIAPQAAIYLTVKLNLAGMTTQAGKILSNSKDITQYLIDEAHVALVPFFAFGSSEDSAWFRLSVGTCKVNEIPDAIASLEKALGKLK